MAKKVRVQLDMTNNKIVNLANPTNLQDAMTLDTHLDMDVDFELMATWRHGTPAETTAGACAMDSSNIATITKITLNNVDNYNFDTTPMQRHMSARDTIIIYDVNDPDTWAHCIVNVLTFNSSYIVYSTQVVLFNSTTAIADGRTYKVKLIPYPNVQWGMITGSLSNQSDLQSVLNGKQTSSTTLTNWSAYNSNGIVVQTSTSSWVARTITAPAAGITITNGNGVSGNPTLVLANDLAALEGLASTGFAVRTATDTWAQRTITGTAGEITVTNGSGASSDPVISLPNTITAGSVGSASAVPVLTYDAKGRLTAATTASINIPTVTTGVLNSTQSTTANTYTTITGHTITIPPGDTIQINGNVVFQTAATTTGIGINVNVVVNASANSGSIGSWFTSINLSNAAAATAVSLGNAFNLGIGATGNGTALSTGVIAANTNHAATYCVVIKNFATNLATTVNIQFASEVNGSAVTLQPGTGFLAIAL